MVIAQAWGNISRCVWLCVYYRPFGNFEHLVLTLVVFKRPSCLSDLKFYCRGFDWPVPTKKNFFYFFIFTPPSTFPSFITPFFLVYRIYYHHFSTHTHKHIYIITMFRNTAARSLARVASASLRRTIATRVSQSAFRSSIPSASLSQRLVLSQQQSQVRFYSAGPAPLTNAFVLERITALLSNYDKVRNIL